MIPTDVTLVLILARFQPQRYPISTFMNRRCTMCVMIAARSYHKPHPRHSTVCHSYNWTACKLTQDTAVRQVFLPLQFTVQCVHVANLSNTPIEHHKYLPNCSWVLHGEYTMTMKSDTFLYLLAYHIFAWVQRKPIRLS